MSRLENGLSFAETIVWGQGFRKTSADSLFGIRGSQAEEEGVWGRNPPLAPLFVLAGAGRKKD